MILFIKNDNIRTNNNNILSNKIIVLNFNSFIFFKLLNFFFLILIYLNYLNILCKYNLQLTDEYLKLKKNLNLNFHNYIYKKLSIAIYTCRIKNGGRARLTSILINYLNQLKLFNIYLFTEKKKEENEFKLTEISKRIIINKNLVKNIKLNRIDLLIYELDNFKEINLLNELNDLKVLFYRHSSIFYWIYDNYTNFKCIYKAFTNSKITISIVPLENNFLFKKWGINSILMTNFMTFEYNLIIPSDSSSHTILMIGRGNDKNKRFELGINSMEYIVHEIENCQLKIISELIGTDNLQNLVDNLDLINSIKFVGYNSSPNIYFKNASLSFFPSITEAFPMVLSETKIYGIPNILLGLDYISIASRGTIIIYDDLPESLSKQAIKILTHKKDRKKLGINARKSMKQYNNKLLISKWIKLIFSIYYDDDYYKNLILENTRKFENESIIMLKNQIKLLKIRENKFNNITMYNFINFTYMQSI